MNGDKTVRTVFEEIKLTVEKSGDGQVNVDPPDTTALPTFAEEYTGATEVTLTAMPDPGWAFVEWTGDLTGTDNPSTLLVGGEKEVRAVFEERKLTVSKEGEGQVSASPPGGAQTPTFTESYGVDTEVTLTAHPATGWAFKEWTGDVNGTDNSATITVNRDRSVTAVFIQIELNVAKTGEGQVWTNGAVGGLRTPPFTESYLPGAQATIVAVPATGWGFKEWTGDKTGTSDTLSFTINESTSITAVFEQVSLEVTKSGSGQVHVDPPDETLTPPFTEGYPINAAVSLTAIPDAGWIFKGWSGDEVTPTNPLSITMSDDKSLIAVFDQRKLVLSRVGSGTATLNPPNVTPNSYPHTEYYSSNATVTLSATPGTGWAFKHWSILGNVVTQNPTSVLVDQHVSATVVFEEIELRVDKEGEGSVGVDPPGGPQTLPYTGAYTGGATVTLSADPEDGWGFQEWQGDVPEGMENDNPLALTMDKARDVTAVFSNACEIDLPTGKVGYTTPAIVNSAKDTLEAWLGVPFGDVEIALEGSYFVRDGECLDPTAGVNDAKEYTGAVQLGASVSDVPWPGLGFAFEEELLFGETQASVSFVAGLTGSIEASLSGDYLRVDHQCPCLEPEICSEVAELMLQGTLSASASVSLEMSAQASLWPFGDISVNLCDLTLIEVGVPGTLQIGLESENCNESTICGGVGVGPFELTARVSGLGFCVEFNKSIPDSPWFLGSPCGGGLDLLKPVPSFVTLFLIEELEVCIKSWLYSLES